MELLLRFVCSWTMPFLLMAPYWAAGAMPFSSSSVTLRSDLSELYGVSPSKLSTYSSISHGVNNLSPAFSPQPLSEFAPSYSHQPSSSPLYPLIPRTTWPKLSGNCSLNFTDVVTVLGQTAMDCAAPFALYLGNVICCPQLESMLLILQGEHNLGSGVLAFNNTEASYCFSDVMNILVSQGSNNTLPALCSVQSANLTGGFCPVTTTADFEQIVNVTKLLVECQGVSPLTECCKPVCQPAISEAAGILAARASGFTKPEGGALITDQQQIIDDCETVVLAWISSQIGTASANTLLRNLFSCRVNKECPLVFNNITQVVGNCSWSNPSNTTCCPSLNKYISDMQHQTLITNLQALDCVDLLGSKLETHGVTADVYKLCNVYLRDFSLQTFGSQGCLLRSIPTDVSEDHTNGISFTCDLNDDIAAPWPSSPETSFSLCPPQVSMPALPGVAPSGGSGHDGMPSFVSVSAVVSIIAVLLQ